MSANTAKPTPHLIFAAIVLAAATACSSSDAPKADSPKDPALVPSSNMTPHDAPYDNRGRGN